ncbi:MAG: GTPase [Pirellulales bacterium]
MYHTDDTIAAIASAPAGAARGIIRISGPGVPAILRTCFHARPEVDLATISRATVASGTIVLGGLRACELPADVYYWPDERSYTRQCAAEIHTVGSPPLVSAVLSTVCRAGARPAEPGEFTFRAFLAGRLDLTQAEAVLGVVDARGEQELKLALDQLAGGLARPLARLRQRLLELLADLEAGLDFVEEDIEFVSRREIGQQLDEAATLLASTAEQLTDRRRSDELPRVVLVGWPNVGKSSLFNALSRPGAALVSDEPGTTRDYLTATLELGASLCQLIDTAGHEPPGENSEISRLAGERTAVQARSCDLALLCLDATRPPNDWERDQLAANPDLGRLVVLTKCDRPRGTDLPAGAIPTSAITGAGLDDLRRQLARALGSLEPRESPASLTAQRCAECMRAADRSLRHAIRLNASAAGEELVAAELRAALAELGKVVGAVYTDDILDRIFSRFCIGK